MIEQWKSIEGYEGLYEVSNLGRVRSIDRDVPYRDSHRHIKGIILQQIYDDDGYLVVRLCRDGKQKEHYVHRLVAVSFIPNTNNLQYVNHINEIKDDNRLDNLEWCTITYNNTYGNRINKEIETKVMNGKYKADHIGLPHKEQKRLWYIEHRDEVNRKRRERRRARRVGGGVPETLEG